MWLTISAGPSWLPRIQIRRKSSRSEFRRMIFRQAKCRLVSRLKFRSSKMSPLMTSSRRLVDGPLEELLEQPCLADVAPQVQVADDDAVKGKVAGRSFVGVESVHEGDPIRKEPYDEMPLNVRCRFLRPGPWGSVYRPTTESQTPSSKRTPVRIICRPVRLLPVCLPDQVGASA